MDLFKSLPWKASRTSLKLCTPVFIEEESANDSYIFDPKILKSFNDDEKTIQSDTNEKKKYYPGNIMYKFPFTSSLNASEMIECIKALDVITAKQGNLNAMSMYEREIVDLYYNNKLKIKKENEKFNEFSRAEWLGKLNKRQHVIKKPLRIMIENMWNSELQKVRQLPRYYMCKSHISLTEKTLEFPISITYSQALLYKGSVRALTLPSLDKKVKLPSTIADLQTILKDHTHLAISQDEDAVRLAETIGADIVVDIDTLSCLLDSDFEREWYIPVAAKELKSGDKNIKTVFIDSPFPQRNPTLNHFASTANDLLMKSFVCTAGDAAIFDDSGTISIKPSLEKSNQHFTSSEGDSDKTKERSFETNYVYSLWIVQPGIAGDMRSELLMKNRPQSYKSYKVIIRGNADGIIKDNENVKLAKVFCKTEYQPDFGAEKLTTSQVCEQWVRLQFQPRTVVAMLRLNVMNSEILSTELLDLRSLALSGNLDKDFAPSRTGALYNILQALQTAEGQMLLRHVPSQGPFADLLLLLAGEARSLDFLGEFDEDQCSVGGVVKWRPIDPGVVLPVHRARSLLPCVFPPCKVENQNRPQRLKKFQRVNSKKRRQRNASKEKQ